MNSLAIAAYIGRHILEIGGDKALTPSTVLSSMKKGMPLASTALPNHEEVKLPPPLYPTTEDILRVMKDLTKLDYLSMLGKHQGANTAFVIGVCG